MDQQVSNTARNGHPVATQDQWLERRTALLEREKAFIRLGDELAAARRDLPWVRVEKDYAFDSPNGARSLADLFDGRSQLFVYHFMYSPEWDEPCRSCSFGADHFDAMLPHLAERDVTLAVASRAPLDRLMTFRKRMGWRFDWYSTEHSDFSFDFGASFTGHEVESGEKHYNYATLAPPVSDLHGASVFFRDRDGAIYHTYSTFGRGINQIMNTYNVLDMMPKGRDEGAFSFPMTWVRYHDDYKHLLNARGGCCGG